MRSLEMSGEGTLQTFDEYQYLIWLDAEGYKATLDFFSGVLARTTVEIRNVQLREIVDQFGDPTLLTGVMGTDGGQSSATVYYPDRGIAFISGTRVFWQGGLVMNVQARDPVILAIFVVPGTPAEVLAEVSGDPDGESLLELAKTWQGYGRIGP